MALMAALACLAGFAIFAQDQHIPRLAVVLGLINPVTPGETLLLGITHQRRHLTARRELDGVATQRFLLHSAGIAHDTRQRPCRRCWLDRSAFRGGLELSLVVAGNATAAALTAPDTAVGIAELLVAANGADLSSSAKGGNCCKEVTAPETGATAADAVVWAAEAAIETGIVHDLLDHMIGDHDATLFGGQLGIQVGLTDRIRRQWRLILDRLDALLGWTTAPSPPN